MPLLLLTLWITDEHYTILDSPIPTMKWRYTPSYDSHVWWIYRVRVLVLVSKWLKEIWWKLFKDIITLYSTMIWWLSTMRPCVGVHVLISCCGLCVWCRLRIDAIVRYILLTRHLTRWLDWRKWQKRPSRDLRRLKTLSQHFVRRLKTGSSSRGKLNPCSTTPWNYQSARILPVPEVRSLPNLRKRGKSYRN